MNAQKELSSKRAWAALTEKAQRSTFAFIALLGLLYKSGSLTRSEVLEKLKAAGIGRDDLQRWRDRGEDSGDGA